MRFFKKTLTIADTRDEEKSRPVSKTPILRPRGVCCDEGTDLTKEMVKSDGEQFWARLARKFMLIENR